MDQRSPRRSGGCGIPRPCEALVARWPRSTRTQPSAATAEATV
jgi:hypothetical protein